MAYTTSGHLLIADISGYARYLTSSELEHAQEVLSSLTGSLVDCTLPPRRVAGLQGDAVFGYRIASGALGGQHHLPVQRLRQHRLAGPGVPRPPRHVLDQPAARQGRAGGIGGHREPHPHTETCPDLGALTVWVQDMHAVWENKRDAIRLRVDPADALAQVQDELPLAVAGELLLQGALGQRRATRLRPRTG